MTTKEQRAEWLSDLNEGFNIPHTCVIDLIEELNERDKPCECGSYHIDTLINKLLSVPIVFCPYCGGKPGKETE